MAEMQTATGDMLRVNPEGAKVEVTLAGTHILETLTRGDGKQGATHPCTPIFGPDRKHLYGLKQHGNMRNELCDVTQDVDGVHVLHTITDSGYPKGIQVQQIMNVANGAFHFTMTHANAGVEAIAVNAGEHCYFAAPQGFAGTTVNGVDITAFIKDNYDGIAIDLKETNSIKISGKPAYTLKQEGLKKAVVWVGKNPETKEIDQTYICIEPVEDDPFGDFFGSPASLLAPGKNRSFTFTLRIQ
jgi:galactose mutarotase-like enzyme